MTNLPVPVTYRIEERGPDGSVLQEWFRDNLARDEALRLFRVLVVGDHEDGRLYPRGERRLVVVATPATSAPVSAENAQDLPLQAWLVMDQEHRRGRLRLGSPTTPTRARATAQAVRASRPLGSSDWVEVREVAR